MTNGDKIPLFSHNSRRLLRCHRISLDDGLRILHTCCQQLFLREKGGRDIVSVLADGQWDYAAMGRDEGSVCQSTQLQPPCLISMWMGSSGENTVTEVCLLSFLTSKGQWKTLSDLTGSSSEQCSKSCCRAACLAAGLGEETLPKSTRFWAFFPFKW